MNNNELERVPSEPDQQAVPALTGFHPSRVRLIKRHHDLGWLALTPLGDSLQFGVAAPTEAEARSKYAEAFLAWERTLGRKGPPTSIIGYEWPEVPNGH